MVTLNGVKVLSSWSQVSPVEAFSEHDIHRPQAGRGTRLWEGGFRHAQRRDKEGGGGGWGNRGGVTDPPSLLMLAVVAVVECSLSNCLPLVLHDRDRKKAASPPC